MVLIVKLDSSEPSAPVVGRGDNRARTASAWRLGFRLLLVLVFSLVAALLVMVGGAVWLPGGPADIDNLVFPVVLFPLIWALLFFYSCLEPRLVRAYVVVIACALGNLALVGWHLYGRSA